MKTIEQKAEEILREHNINMDEPNFITRLCLAMNANHYGSKPETKSETKNDIPAKGHLIDRLSDGRVTILTDEKIKTFITDRGNVYEIMAILSHSDVGENLVKDMFVLDDKDMKTFDIKVSDKNRLLCLGRKVGVEIFSNPIDPMENECDREVVQELLEGLGSAKT